MLDYELPKFKPIPIRLLPKDIPEDQLGILKRYGGFHGNTEDWWTWGQHQLNVPEAQSGNYRGQGVKVAVLDTGIAEHKDIARNLVGKYNPRARNEDVTDKIGHGSHVAGIIAAPQNCFGTVGVSPEVDLLVCKVFDDNGKTDSYLIESGIYWAVEQGADLINLSLGGPVHDVSIQNAIRHATKAGTIVFAAAGNSGQDYPDTSDSIEFPAKHRETIAIASLKQWFDGNKPIGFERSTFSSTGPKLNFTLPGENIIAPWYESPTGYAMLDGTSMATPFAVGLAALVLEMAHKTQFKALGEPSDKRQYSLVNHMNICASTELIRNYNQIAHGLGYVDALKLVTSTSTQTLEREP